MKVLERLLELAGDRHGFVTARDAAAAGIDPAAMRKLAARGSLERRAQGLYRITAFPVRAHDELMEAALWPAGRGVVSHESAIELWGLADVNPRHIYVTVPSGYQPRKKGAGNVRVHKRDLTSDQLDEVDGIPVTTALVSIADVIDTGTEPRLVLQAIAAASARNLVGDTEAARLRVRLDDRTI